MQPGRAHPHGLKEIATLGGPHDCREHRRSNCPRHNRPDSRPLGDTPQLGPLVEHYEDRGYRVLAPAYPSLEVEVESLNEDPSPIEALTIPGVVEHYEGIIGELEKPPILMGHSMGGLIVQILLDHGYGAVGADLAIKSATHEWNWRGREPDDQAFIDLMPTRFASYRASLRACANRRTA
jgi:pimeloyl-ACP methyl ester carboxylesterase